MITFHGATFAVNNQLLHIDLPGAEMGVDVGFDYYGLKHKRLQVLCFEDAADEPQVSVRYGAAGKVVEIQVRRGIPIVHEGDHNTPWEIERDGPAYSLVPATEEEMPPMNTAWSWLVRQHTDGKFYWYNDQGYPQGPYSAPELAWQGLEDYDATYYDER